MNIELKDRIRLKNKKCGRVTMIYTSHDQIIGVVINDGYRDDIFVDAKDVEAKEPSFLERVGTVLNMPLFV